MKETGEIQKVAMVDDYTKVQISKTDMVTKKELPGAKLTIFNSNNEKIEEWTSGKEPHMIEKLKPGTYTLREVTAPKGYEVAEDVKFTVRAAVLYTVDVGSVSVPLRSALNERPPDVQRPAAPILLLLRNGSAAVTILELL